MLQLKKNYCLYGHTFSSYLMLREKALYLNVPALLCTWSYTQIERC